ncbi:hypothetical protein SBA5_290188 [Candidatus Sulfotelmatomonas gaucii]|uniref:Uncharacterized protein n=1 Tax=Candidatus Sulfuritelmatomonas gaucii TaxID=2043161 RepID=A0A2N9LBB6_9BACT|nr:hypothetical protein SBA5_290188 [Candidatus Sulfotelmatomonas gaucii]
MKCRVQGPLLYLKNFVRDLMNALGDRPPMQSAERQRSQNKKIESALRKIDLMLWHAYPLFFDKKITPFLSKCKGGNLTGTIQCRRI